MAESDDKHEVLSQYLISDDLASGSFGIVKYAIGKEDNTPYAMKILSKSRLKRKGGLLPRSPKHMQQGRPPGCNDSLRKTPLERVYQEIAILKKLSHPNIVRLHQVFDVETEDNLILVFEYLNGGPIITVPTTDVLSEETVRKYTRDVLLGLEYLHFQKIIHRDIKPDNLLLSSDHTVKIVDFGVSDKFEGDDALIHNTVGTPSFLAPELLQENSTSSSGRAVDIWALGVTIYCMLFGEVPFTAKTKMLLYGKICKDELELPEHIPITKELSDLLFKLMEKDVHKRIDLQGVMQDKWTTQNGSKPLSQQLKSVEVSVEDIAKSVTKVNDLKTL